MSSQSDHVVGVSTDERNADGTESTMASVFMKTKASSLSPSSKSTKIIHCLNTDNVNTALKLLIDHSILSVPILNRRTKKYTAFIDIVDILTHYLEVFGENFTQDADWKEAKGDIDAYIKAKGLLSAECGKVANKSGRNAFYAIDGEAPVRAVVDNIVKEDVHRVPIVSRDGELQTVITQSALVRWLDANITGMGKFPEKSVKELGIGIRDEVYSISHEKPTFEAFRLLKEKQVSGVAVLDDNKRLVGNISVSDMKVVGYQGNLFAPLRQSCGDFVASVQKAAQDKLADKDDGKTPLIPGPIAVTPEATLEEVFKKLVITRVHRVYIVDRASAKLVGVISLGDLLSAIRTHIK